MIKNKISANALYDFLEPKDEFSLWVKSNCKTGHFSNGEIYLELNTTMEILNNYGEDNK